MKTNKQYYSEDIRLISEALQAILPKLKEVNALQIVMVNSHTQEKGFDEIIYAKFSKQLAQILFDDFTIRRSMAILKGEIDA